MVTLKETSREFFEELTRTGQGTPPHLIFMHGRAADGKFIGNVTYLHTDNLKDPPVYWKLFSAGRYMADVLLGEGRDPALIVPRVVVVTRFAITGLHVFYKDGPDEGYAWHAMGRYGKPEYREWHSPDLYNVGRTVQMGFYASLRGQREGSNYRWN